MDQNRQVSSECVVCRVGNESMFSSLRLLINSDTIQDIFGFKVNVPYQIKSIFVHTYVADSPQD